FE
ncbi:adenylate kinase family protein, partial [Chlamydia psittaci 84-8471/1]